MWLSLLIVLFFVFVLLHSTSSSSWPSATVPEATQINEKKLKKVDIDSSIYSNSSSSESTYPMVVIEGPKVAPEAPECILTCSIGKVE